MRVLVTGANGLLGSTLCRLLLARHDEVVAFVRPHSNRQALDNQKVRFVQGDVRDASSVENAAQNCELIFHAAAVFSYWGYSIQEMTSTAELGTRNVLLAAKKSGCRRVVLTSSSAVFGGTPLPVARDEKTPFLSGDAPDYFRTKVLQEQSASDFAQQHGIDLVLTNPTVFLGPRDFRPSASLQTITGYLMDPLKLTYPGGINIVHAEDVAQAHLLLAEKGKSYERHIVGSENLEWSAIHQTIAELCGIPSPKIRVPRWAAMAGAALMEGAAWVTQKPPMAPIALAKQVGMYFWYNSDKLRALGWQPRPSKQVLAETIAWLLTSSHLTPELKQKLNPAHEVLQKMSQFT